MNKQQTNQWIEDTMPMQVIRRFRLDKAQGSIKINSIVTYTPKSAQELVDGSK